MRPTDLFLLQNKPSEEPSEELFQREQAQKHREVYRATIMWIQEHGYAVAFNGKQFVLYKKDEVLTDENQWLFDQREDTYRKAFELISTPRPRSVNGQ